MVSKWLLLSFLDKDKNDIIYGDGVCLKRLYQNGQLNQENDQHRGHIPKV